MNEIFFLAYIPVGILGGVLMSCLGFGAGLIAVPTLFLGLSYFNLPTDNAMHMAVGTTLFVMFFNGVNATFIHHKRNTIDWNIVFKFAPFIGCGAVMGTLIASDMSGDYLRYLFIAYIIYSIFKTLSKKSTSVFSEQTIHFPHSLSTAGLGILIGVISTLLGIGGSVFTVPFFRNKKLSMHRCIAMAAALSLPVAVIGTIGYLIAGWSTPHLPRYSMGYIYWPAAFSLVIGGSLGIHLGAKLVYRLSEKTLIRLYVSMLIIIVITMSLR